MTIMPRCASHATSAPPTDLRLWPDDPRAQAPAPADAHARRRESCALKAAFAFTVVLEPERYAGYYSCELSRVRPDSIETLLWSIADLPGLCNLSAGLRWHAPGVKSLAPGRQELVPRRPKLRVCHDLTVEVDRDAYARWAQVARPEARRDLATYTTSEIAALCCLNGYGAEVRWHRPSAPCRPGAAFGRPSGNPRATCPTPRPASPRSTRAERRSGRDARRPLRRFSSSGAT